MDVEHAGNMDNILLSLETEVKELTDKLSVELFIRLLDKWEADVARDRAEGKDEAHRNLYRYVVMKVALHHMKKKFNRDFWSPCDLNGSKLGEQIETFTSKVKDARRNYYVAKRRAEGEHRNDCTCRGCRCLRQDG